MFTGLVTHIGRVAERSGDLDVTFSIESGLDPGSIAIGASISHSGVCLTVTGISGMRHQVTASGETLARTGLGGWQPGVAVNLERSLRLGDELGGHIVFGHVDGLGKITTIAPMGDAHRLEIELPAELEGLVATKGSIAIDGVSLTVNAITGRTVSLTIIQHSWRQTTLQHRGIGDLVHVEADMLARYVARQLQWRANQSQARDQ